MRKNDCLEEIEVYLMAALENTASSLKAKRELKETKVKHNIKEKSSYKCVFFFCSHSACRNHETIQFCD